MNRFLLLVATLSFFAPIVARSAPPTTLEGTQWVLKEVNSKPADVASEGGGAPTLRFDATNKQVSGFAGVNRFFGGYTLKENALKLGPLGSTMMAGPQEAMKAESAYLKALEEIDRWRLVDGKLELLHGEKVVALFTTPPTEAK